MFLSEALQRIAPESCISLFHDYGVHLLRQRETSRASISPVTAEKRVAGVIGFNGPRIRGSLLLVSSFRLIAQMRPCSPHGHVLSERSSSDWLIVRDWVAELANQLIGRIKNKLIPYGLAIEVSSPTALSGNALAFARPKHDAVPPFFFVSRSDRLWFWVDAVFDPGAQVTSDGELKSAKEGEVILF